MTDTSAPPQPPAAPPLHVRLLLLLFGVGLALVLLTALFLLFPGLIPEELTEARYDRRRAGTSVEVEYHHTDGDTFAWLPGRVRPPVDDAVLARFTLAWDADGWRLPAVEAVAYPIAAFGDSFTEGMNVALPWVDRLAELTGVPVRNYGYRGYGPLEIERAAAEFAPQEPRRWVLYAYFSGNDLSEANHSAASMERSPFYLLPHLVERAAENVADDLAAADPAVHYDFPMPVIIGANYYELVLLPRYLWWQLAPPQGFLASRTLEIVGETLDSIAASLPPQTCLGLIFVPTKEQLYYPYLVDPQWMLGIAEEMLLDEQRRLQLRPAPRPADDHAAVVARLGEQRDAVAALVSARPRWRLIDLTPAFAEAVGRGELLYYPYDSHWNQAGHDFAAQVIAQAVGQGGCE